MVNPSLLLQNIYYIWTILLYFLVQCALSHHHGARRSSNRNSFTFFRLHCLYVLTRWRAGLCMGSILAEFLAGHIHNWLKSMALKTPSTKRYIGEIKSNNVWSYPQTYSVDHQWHLWQLIHTLFCFGSIHTLFTAHSMIEWELLIKKVTPKILSKSISRMPMGSLVGH